MQVRRCAVLYIEPREELGVDWSALFSGVSALSATMRWVALAPHLDGEREIDAAELAVLGSIGQTQWGDRAALDERAGAEVVERLLAAGLLIGDAPEHAHHRERDETLRSQHWRPLSALAHGFSRWEGMKVDSGMQFPTFEQLVENYGAPPPPAVDRGDTGRALALPAPQAGPLDQFMLNRYTGRNFDKEAVLPLDVAARMLQRAFGAQDQREMAPGAFVFKKAAPSAGGLHPIEAYVLVQRVEGVPVGLYHYHPVKHTLAPIKALGREEAAALALAAVADQDWFADAPIMVVLAARVERNFWKYRNHVKAYRALLLDAGHLSQTWYLLASEAGMPAFITAAINEIDLEKAFGLDPLRDAVIAVCGCGKSSGAEDTVEMRFQA
jgi:putative peptide maturation dehydrogenase